MAPRIKLSERLRAMTDSELREWVSGVQTRTLARVASAGGHARAHALTAAQRSAIASKAGKAGGWPKGKKRGPRKPKAVTTR